MKDKSKKLQKREMFEQEKVSKNTTPPDLSQLENELSRETYKIHFWETLKSTVFSLIVVVAFAVLVATLLLPVLRIYGGSMTPTFEDGQVVVSVKSDDFEQGDIVSFYVGPKLLVKRYIAGPGSWINIDDAGNVFVDGDPLDEPYVSEKSLGECDLVFPYQVPEDKIFVLGDHRLVSVDSRSNAVGCVPYEQIVGKIVFRVWPIKCFGFVE